jgi:hypothetical protein
MFKYSLNFGSIFGAVVCGSAAAAILYLLSNNVFPPRSIKFVAMAALGGAALGNWIWSLAAPSDPEGTMWGPSANRDEEQGSA